MEQNTIDIDELERLAKAATPGPWGQAGCRVTAKELGYDRVADTEFDNDSMAENAAFIAAANPTTITALIDSLHKANGRLHEVATHCANVEAERDESKMRIQILERNLHDAEEAGRRLAKQAHQAEQEAERLLNACSQPQLTVCFGFMYESSGKTNWTAILHRRDDPIWKGITIERSECKDRVRYEADRVRWLIGELKDEPDIVEYKGDLTEQVLAEPVNARLVAAAKAALDALTCSGEADDPGHRCGHCDDYVDRNGVVRAALRDALSAAEAQQAKPVRSPGVCQGTNCGATNGANHSPECIVETAEAQGWGNAPEAMEARRLIAQKAEPVNARLVDALKRCEAAFDIYHSCFQVTGNETGMADAAKYIMVARSALAAAKAQQADSMQLTRESVARAIWGVRREYEDRCDMELEDMGDSHPVWDEADAVLAIAERVQSGVAWLTTEQARNAERYAYLRSQHEGSVAASFAVFAPEQPIGEFGPVGSMPGELDAAIDSAMRADSHKVEG